MHKESKALSLKQTFIHSAASKSPIAEDICFLKGPLRIPGQPMLVYLGLNIFGRLLFSRTACE